MRFSALASAARAATTAGGGTIQDMEVTQPDLEDVFLRLMQEN